MAGGNVFISYRRDDSAGQAGRIYDNIRTLTRARVFMDVSDIGSGAEFVKVIERELANCAVVLVVIGRRWLDLKDESGSLRLLNPEDYVRLEVGLALRSDSHVIPVLVDGAAMPKQAQLPLDLQPLASRNASEIRHTAFQQDVQKLANDVQRELAARAAPAPPPKATWWKWALPAAGLFLTLFLLWMMERQT